MSRPKCLVVDDEPIILELSAQTLSPMNIDCVGVGTYTDACEQLKTQTFDLCLTDMHLPDGNGIDLVNLIQREYSNIPVAVITAFGSVESAVQALKAGAFDFVTKPVDIKELRNLVATALKLAEKHEESFSSLVGESTAIQALRVKIAKLARSQAPVYIRGESGVGKEVVARLLHAQGARASKPFVPVNCGAIPTELMESEFFGHKKGSFTGATADKQGLFQIAQGGTLFLDEVADLPLHMQVKLLRVIQEKQMRPVGATKEIPVDVRILSATHRDLADLVKQGKFRQDLFYRINVIELHVPPLRERTQDIPLLVERILQKLTEGNGNAKLRLSANAMAFLQSYHFPGNVRELENILERAMTLCDDNVIQIDDLQLPKLEEASNNHDEYTEDDLLSIATLEENSAGLDPLLEDLERDKIMKALEKTKGNKTRAARLLGISFGALRYRLTKFKLHSNSEQNE
ncbi:response regulator with CheY-like receiver, AAA-type ATPase, and DNA-binding domains [Beggiatoa alba B18LD]|uniref:Response regulator with CheY-like receiver, AAA-type ATPase, and DNA-binding domains n=1 Tax=Beggiatoa alba B18LD TaxID=395493 RepID=I3CGK0_9GAMM|nr:sigma-54 dependent transcriptional regulator [Beggiatoa alba]EIJ42743.1 response regulator with CheY-like receiver, AAA-type ATPase, and DNA-binding domains [Beggiatoa alba B18LD]